MKTTTWMVMLAVLIAAPLALAAEKVLFEQNFESPEAAESLTRKGTELSEPGFESARCASRTEVTIHNNIGVKTDVVVEDGMVLTFDYRTEVRAGQIRYLGLYLLGPDGKKMISTAKPATEWARAEIPLAQFRIDAGSKVKEAIVAGETISQVQFYGRGEDKTTDIKADQTIYIDNVKWVVK